MGKWGRKRILPRKIVAFVLHKRRFCSAKNANTGARASRCRARISQSYNRAPDIQIAALPPSAQVWVRGHRHSRQREPLLYWDVAGEADRHIEPTCPSFGRIPRMNTVDRKLQSR